MKDNHRTKTVGCKMTENEHALIESLAQRKGKSLSDWCREALIACAVAEQKPKVDLTRTVLEELLALRTILMTILFRIASGQKLGEDQMKAVVEKADGSKRSRAEELLGKG
jgi:hypothetical protein